VLRRRQFSASQTWLDGRSRHVERQQQCVTEYQRHGVQAENQLMYRTSATQL